MTRAVLVLAGALLAGCEEQADRLTQVCTYSTLQPNGELIVTHYLCDREKLRFLQQPDDVLSICTPNGEAVGTWRALNYNQEEIGRTVVMVARGWSGWPESYTFEGHTQPLTIEMGMMKANTQYRVTVQEVRP